MEDKGGADSRSWGEQGPGEEGILVLKVGLRLSLWHGGKAGSQVEVKPGPGWR